MTASVEQSYVVARLCRAVQDIPLVQRTAFVQAIREQRAARVKRIAEMLIVAAYPGVAHNPATAWGASPTERVEVAITENAKLTDIEAQILDAMGVQP